MRTWFMDKPSRAVLDLVSPGVAYPWWTITRINVPVRSRGRGLGSMLLKQALAQADKEGLTVCLEVAPSGGLTSTQLRSWYRRHGFKASSIWGLPIMLRHPINVEDSK